MKKTLSLLLMVTMIIAIVPAYAEDDVVIPGATMVIYQDFEDAVKDATVTPQVINAQNYAGEPVDEVYPNLPWVISGSSNSYTTATNARNNPTTYISLSNKGNSDITMNTPSPLGEDGEIVYVDVQICISDMYSHDPLNLNFQDNAGKNIFTLSCANARIPILHASTQYGTDTNVAENTVITYPYTGNVSSWVYLRAVMDFSRDEVSLYQGSIPYGDDENLVPLVKNVPTVGFRDAAAANFSKINKTGKGGLCFDNLRVYTKTPLSIPSATDVAISGSIALGSTLTASYDTYSDPAEIAEGDTYGYWQSSNEFNFISTERATADTLIKAGETDQIEITEALTGKYLRYVVVPVNANGDEGYATYSLGTSFPINFSTHILGGTGALKGSANRFDNKFSVNNYGGKITVMTSKSSNITGVLIAAFYDNGELISLASTKVDIAPAPDDSLTGIVQATVTTDTAASMLAGTDLTHKRLVIYYWDGLNDIKPLSKTFTIGP